MEKLNISLPIIVEGKYDKNTLSSIVNARIITTGGFGIFNRADLTAMLRGLAERSKIILLLDSDGGGRQIRSFIEGTVPRDRIINLYIPQISGKERRKTHAGKAGLLGVEGMSAELLRELLLPFSDTEAQRYDFLTKQDFYLAGLSGGEGSAKLRAELARELGLPSDLSANALIEAINMISSEAQYRRALDKITEKV